MEEKKFGKRKDWIKNFAIIFLAVLLVLTFFSNTILNYSLPEVAVQYITSDSITTRVRGTGVVSSADSYNVMVKQTKTVASIEVRKGDFVNKGDLLMTLEDEDSDELKQARENLKSAQDAYDMALLSATLTQETIDGSKLNTSVTTYRENITAAQKKVENQEAVVKKAQEEYDAITKKIATLPGNTADVSAETAAFNTAKTNKENADFALTSASNTVSSLESKLNYYYAVSGDGVENTVADLEKKLDAAKLDLIAKQDTANAAQLAYDKASTALANKQSTGDTSATLTQYQAQQAAAQEKLTDAQETLTELQNDLNDLASEINSRLNLSSLYAAIDTAKAAVEKEEAAAIGGEVLAPISGTITEINVTSGKELDPNYAVMNIQPEGKGYTMSFSVTNEQAKKISVGDRAELVNSWWYDNVNATVSSIRPDTSNPATNKLIYFNLEGDLSDGQSLSLSVGSKSANYDLVVPTSAIREDNNGKFILVVESKSTPLGNRYIATRYDVEVVASDDTKSAITAGLYGYEYVITTSTKPVSAGDQVRLANN